MNQLRDQKSIVNDSCWVLEGGSGMSTKSMERRMSLVVEHLSHRHQRVWGNRQALSLAEIQGFSRAIMGKESARES